MRASRTEQHPLGACTGIARHSRRLWIPGRQGTPPSYASSSGRSKIQRYVHTGTGNYNRETAKVYTDIGLFTTDPDIVADTSEIFNYLTGYSNQKDYRASSWHRCSCEAA